MSFVRYDVESPGQIIAFGATLLELFENAAYGMFDYLFEIEGRDPERDVPIMAIGDEPAELLQDWLDQILELARRHEVLPTYFQVARLETGGVQGAFGGVRGPFPIANCKIDPVGVVPTPTGWWVRLECHRE